MTLKSYLWGMRLSTIFSAAAFILVIFYTDPEKGELQVKLAFYLTFFLFLSSIFVLMLTAIRRKFKREGAVFSDLGVSFREGSLLALLVIVLLILQSFRFLTWWDGLLAVAGIFLVELYFLTK
ncbi:MAG: hypothetical protein V1804_03185 [Patescibacteria group bacterium]